MIKKLLITGATGYLGRYFLKEIYKEFDCYALVRESSDLKAINCLDNEKFLLINQLKGTEQFDVILHLATSYGRGGEQDEEIKNVNVELPLILLNLYCEQKITFINIGTALPKNVNTYAESKAEFELRAKEKCSNCRFVNVILQQFYGPNDGTLISFLIKSLSDNTAKIKMTKGEQVRDLIFIDDVTSALKLIVMKSEFFNLGETSIELGSGSGNTIKAIAQLLCQLMNVSEQCFNWGALAYRANEPMTLTSDINFLKGLGWKPRYDLKSGLKETLSRLEYINKYE